MPITYGKPVPEPEQEPAVPNVVTPESAGEVELPNTLTPKPPAVVPTLEA
jgi:hypothetical protein